MRFTKITLFFLALGLGLLRASTSNAAPIVIDNFDSTTSLAPDMMFGVGITVFPGNPGPIGVVDASAGVNAMFGGVRNVTLGGFSGAAGNTVSATIAGGVLNYASSNGGNSELTLVYNSAGANLSGSIGLTFDIVDFDHANMADMAVTLTITSGMDSASSTQTLTTDGMQSLSWLYTSFNMGTGIGSVDLSNITQITVYFNAQVAHDFVIDNFQTMETVPEPASILAWGLVIGVGVLGRRRYKSLAA